MKKEVWKVITGYPNYMVSNTGNVKVLQVKQNYIERGKIKTRVRNEKVLSPKLRGNSIKYLFVNLSNENGRKAHVIHRLVASAFISNPEKKQCVNHIDNNPLNNTLDNLEWCTASENMQHCMNQNRHPQCIDRLTVLKMVSMYESNNFSLQTIADHFKMSYQNSSKLIYRNTDYRRKSA